jgi:hypothetical protein
MSAAAMSGSALRSSWLWDAVNRLSALSGSFYFYEPRERMRGSGSGSPLIWESVNPNQAESLCYGELSGWSSELGSSLGSGVTRLSPLEALERISERKAWSSVSLVFVPSLTESGDYGGSTYALSNAEALLEEFGGSAACREVIGGYGSYALAIDPRYVSEDLLEALESLENYPVHCEEHLSVVEERLRAEAFSSWLESDLRRLIERVTLEALLQGGVRDTEEAEEEAEKIAEEATDEELWDILSHADAEGGLWAPEHNSMWCDLDRIPEESILQAFLSEEVAR